MVDTILMFFLTYLAIGFAITSVGFLLYACHVRRLIRSRRMVAIKTLFGHHYRRQAFLIAGKR